MRKLASAASLKATTRQLAHPAVPDIQRAKCADVLNMDLLKPSLVKQDARNAPNSVVTAMDRQGGAQGLTPLPIL